MRIKVDEDLPAVVGQVLRTRGHDVATVFEEGLGGAKDPDLWRAVQAEGRFLVTADKGFGDLRCYPPGSHAGVLLLRPDEIGNAGAITGESSSTEQVCVGPGSHDV